MCLADQWDSIPDDINVFPLLHSGSLLLQQVNLIHLKDRYLSKPFLYFQELLSQHFRDFEQISLERVV